MAAGSATVVGLAALSASLASHTSVVSVTAQGGSPPYTSSYNTGHVTGSGNNIDSAQVKYAVQPDTRTWFVVWNA